MPSTLTHGEIAEHMRRTLVPSEQTVAQAAMLLKAGQSRVYSVAGISSPTNPDVSLCWVGDESVVDMGVVSSCGSTVGEMVRPPYRKALAARAVALDTATAIASETDGAAWFVFTEIDGAACWAAFIV